MYMYMYISELSLVQRECQLNKKLINMYIIEQSILLTKDYLCISLSNYINQDLLH